MFADAHISSLGNLCFFFLISEGEGEPWDEGLNGVVAFTVIG